MALDFFAGCLGGCAGVVVGHPLDTIKIHLQTQDAKNPKYKGTLDCFRHLLAKEGVRGLYRGMTSPLAGVAAINAIVFGVYGNTQRHLPNPDSLTSHFCAGAIAGLAQSFLCSPMELAKSRLQLASGPSKTPWDCLKQIYSRNGFAGLFRGLGMTVMREVPAFGSYFWTYEFLTRGDEPVSTLAMLNAGGVAGAVSWALVYPVDVIKSRMQIDDRYRNSLDCLRVGVKGEGWGFLFRGLAPTLVRAFPVNAATFAVVTWTMRGLGEDGGELWGRCSDAVYALKVETAPV